MGHCIYAGSKIVHKSHTFEDATEAPEPLFKAVDGSTFDFIVKRLTPGPAATSNFCHHPDLSHNNTWSAFLDHIIPYHVSLVVVTCYTVSEL